MLRLLLGSGAQRTRSRREIRYVLVDEYQDTNYVQEQLLLKLTEQTGNLCVVGDEDQSLYRFRGATVRNILEFPQRVPGVPRRQAHDQLPLPPRDRRALRPLDGLGRLVQPARRALPLRQDHRGRSERRASGLPGGHQHLGAGRARRGRPLRRPRRVPEAATRSSRTTARWPCSCTACGKTTAARTSPRWRRAASRPSARGPAPTSRTTEIRLMVACFAVLFGWHGERARPGGRRRGRARRATWTRASSSWAEASHRRIRLPQALQAWVGEIAALGEGESLDLRPADYFYRLLALDPFARAVKNENAARNLAIFSQLLNVFQSYYHYTVVTHRNREFLRFHLFNSFLRLLHDGGINEYEDPDQPFPKGHVQVMTIHQAKGLEFPVVVVGSPQHAAFEPQADRPRPRALLPPPALRAREPDHPLRPDAAALRRLLAAAEGAGPHRARSPEGPLRAHLAGASAVALRAEGAAGGAALRPARADAGQEDLQLHRRPQDLRDLPAPVPVLPRVRLHAVAFGGDLLRPARAPDHRGDPPHCARRQARHAGRAAHPRALRPHLPLPSSERRAAHRRRGARGRPSARS